MKRTNALTTILLVIPGMMGCPGATCPEGTVMEGGDCVAAGVDAAGLDARPDAGETRDGAADAQRDASHDDGGAAFDASVHGDAGDAGQSADADAEIDARQMDAGVDAQIEPDAFTLDAFTPDAGLDSGPPDACTPRTYYRDMDMDGTGNPMMPMMGCVQPAGYVISNTDCDDMDDQERPGLAEVCDGKNNDCDAMTDEGLLTTYYRDSDGDGYGDPSMSRMACSLPAGYANRAMDCDDSQMSAYPGNMEVCDGINNDCDFATEERVRNPLIDENFGCIQGRPSSCTTTCGSMGTGTCTASCMLPAPAACTPPAETCNGREDDCAMGIDNGVARASTPTSASSLISGHVRLLPGQGTEHILVDSFRARRLEAAGAPLGAEVAFALASSSDAFTSTAGLFFASNTLGDLYLSQHRSSDLVATVSRNLHALNPATFVGELRVAPVSSQILLVAVRTTIMGVTGISILTVFYNPIPSVQVTTDLPAHVPGTPLSGASSGTFSLVSNPATGDAWLAFTAPISGVPHVFVQRLNAAGALVGSAQTIARGRAPALARAPNGRLGLAFVGEGEQIEFRVISENATSVAVRRGLGTPPLVVDDATTVIAPVAIAASPDAGDPARARFVVAALEEALAAGSRVVVRDVTVEGNGTDISFSGTTLESAGQPNQALDVRFSSSITALIAASRSNGDTRTWRYGCF